MYLFFDTETTGLSRNSDHVVQVAWILADANGRVEAEECHVIRPQGFSIPWQAAEIHGITTAIAEKLGKPLHYVLKQLSADTEMASVIVAHNLSFDLGILQNDYDHIHLPFPFHGKTQVCTMKLSTTWCRLPKLNGGTGFKWPKLEELHYRLFGKAFDNAHDALSDTRACMRCYFDLVERGVIDPPPQSTSTGRQQSTPTITTSFVRHAAPTPPIPPPQPPLTKESQLAYKATHHDPAVRITVASDQDCPEAIQLLLTDDADENVKIALAKNTACTSKVFERLANDECDGVTESVALNPSCPVAVLRLLYENDQLLGEWIVDNPVAPPDLLAEFHWYGWGGLNHPNFSRDAYDIFLRRMAESEDTADRSLVAEKEDCPTKYLLKLADDPSADVLKSLADNKSTPSEALHIIAVGCTRQSDADAAVEVLCQIAQRVDCPQKLLRELADEPYAAVWQRIALNPSCPNDLLVDWSSCAFEKKTFSSEQGRIAAVALINPNNPVAQAQAQAESIDESSVQALSTSPYELVRQLLASNKNCPISILKLLAQDVVPEVRVAVASHPNCLPYLLDALSLDPVGLVRLAAGKNPNCSPNTLRSYATSHFYEYRELAAKHPKCPQDALKLLATDQRTAVRAAVVNNPACPLEIRAPLYMAEPNLAKKSRV